MLNASPEGEEQSQPLHTWEAAIRSRTPWDAGGYSLPVNHDLDTTVNKNIHYNDSLIDSTHIYSSKHALSDSRGSLSSFASASTSTHSRFSSASTVSGFHAFSSPSDTLKFSDLQGDWSTFITPSTALSPASPATFSFHHYPVSPHADTAKVLALIAERQHSSSELSPQDQARDTAMADMEDTTERDTTLEPVQLPRAKSPTDALLIKRPTPPRSEMPNEATEIIFTQPFAHRTAYVPNDAFQAQPSHRNALPSPEGHKDFDSHSSRFASESRRHKRAFSAPHIQATGESSFHQETTEMVPRYERYEPTPPLSHHPGNTSPQDEILDAPLNLAPDNTPPLQEQPTCMFKEGCDTGSQPRKAVSHIFGRNKMCTRLIPEHVWVRYCRKHYQRSRYREPKNWPRSQCDLVQKQIQRLQEWSADNERRGHGGVVRSWGLAVRKREQKRLDDLALSVARDPGRHGGAGLDETALGASAPATAVPAWLRDLCGRTYNTSDIRDIFNRVHQDLLDSVSPVFPDIEILPHITLDGEEPGSPVRYSNRKSPTTHHRAHSMGVGLSQSPDSFSGSTPLPTYPSSTFEHLESPTLHKRKHGDDSPGEVEPGLITRNQRLRLDVATGIPGHELPHRSMLCDSRRVCETLRQHGGIDAYQSPTTTSTSPTQPQEHLSHTSGSAPSTVPSRHPLRPATLHAPESTHRRSRSALSSFPHPDASPPSQSSPQHLTPRAQDAAAAAPQKPPLPLYPPGEAHAAPAPARRPSAGHARHQSSPACKAREEGGALPLPRGARREVAEARAVFEKRR